MAIRAYIQIYKQSPLCTTTSTEHSHWTTYVLITPEKEFLKISGIDRSAGMFVSQYKYCDVIHTFIVNFQDVKKIFEHSKDLKLDVEINNNSIFVTGDNRELLYKTFFDTNVEKLSRRPLIIAANRDFLSQHNLSFF